MSNGPARVAAQAVVDPSLCDERGDDDEAAVAKRQGIIDPGSGRGVDRLGAESLTEPLGKPIRNVLARDPELARVGVEAQLVAVVRQCHSLRVYAHLHPRHR